MLGKLIVSSAFVFGSTVALAGANNAEITCKSASGRTVIEANVPGDFNEAMIKITVDGKSKTYLDQGMVDSLEINGRDPQQEYPGYEVAGINSLRDKSKISVDAFSQTGERFEEELLSLKSVGALKKLPSSGSRLKFNATVKGMDPREEFKALPDGIVVSCLYVYEI